MALTYAATIFSVCGSLKIKIYAENDHTKQKLQLLEQETYRPNLMRFVNDLKEKSELAKKESSVETLCFDFENNLPLPEITTGAYFIVVKFGFITSVCIPVKFTDVRCSALTTK
jgi:hypothetical protein